jgi:hypothetical protein
MTSSHHFFFHLSPWRLFGATRGEILPIFQHLQLLGLLQDLLGSWCPVDQKRTMAQWKVLHFDVFLYVLPHMVISDDFPVEG